MPSTSLAGATVGQQDFGTGLDTAQPRDPISAGMIAAGDAHATDYHTCSIATNWSTNQLTVSDGGAYLSVPGTISVQTESGGDQTYDRDWHGPVSVPVSVPETTIDLESGDNDVYLVVDVGENNAVSLEWGTSVSPSDPALLIATADTGSESHTTENPAPDTDHGNIDVDDEVFVGNRARLQSTSTGGLTTNIDGIDNWPTNYAAYIRANESGIGLWQSSTVDGSHDDVIPAVPMIRLQRGTNHGNKTALIVAGNQSGGFAFGASRDTWGIWQHDADDEMSREDSTQHRRDDSVFHVTSGGTVAANGDPVVVGDDEYQIQVNGTDGPGIINFHTD